MKSEIISVGTEILMGDITDTNSAYISKRLTELGINCYYHTAVGDNEGRLTETIQRALNRSDIVFLSGGLGPTYDDMTKEIVAKVMGLEMEFDEKSYQRIVDIFAQSKRKLTNNNRKQAYIPKGAKVLTNFNGTAPGILIEKNNKVVVLLPGPPLELKAMFETWIMPYFAKKTGKTIVSHRVYLFGIGESYVEEILNDAMVHYTNPTIAPYASDGSIYLRVTASENTKEAADALISPVIDEIKAHFEDYIYSVDIPTLEETLVLKLKEKNLKLASAESCTAGYFSKRITDVPGSSAVFELGVTAYSNQIKEQLLKVDKVLLEEKGAVSKECVEAMSQGVLELANADIAVSISGIAGPSGGTEEKPVGLVYINVATKTTSLTKEYHISRNYNDERERVRFMSVSYALKQTLDFLNSLD